MVVSWAAGRSIPNGQTYAQVFAPDWLPPVAAGVAAAGLLPLERPPTWVRLRRALRWIAFPLLVWAANGLPLDVLRVVGLIPLGVDWSGLATRALALAIVVVLARPILTGAVTPMSAHPAAWYGYAAFVFALPYPVLRTHWALGGTLGLLWPGAAGVGFEAWVFCIPWLVAAALSLFLVSPPHWMPRRLLLVGGWSGTAIVGMIGPAACWALVGGILSGTDASPGGIEIWVPALFYGSWLLWAVAAGAATLSYQARSAGPRTPSPA